MLHAQCTASCCCAATGCVTGQPISYAVAVCNALPSPIRTFLQPAVTLRCYELTSGNCSDAGRKCGCRGAAHATWCSASYHTTGLACSQSQPSPVAMGNVASCATPQRQRDLLKAAKAGDTQHVLDTLWSTKSFFDSSQGCNGRTIWHVAAKRGHLHLLQAVWDACIDTYDGSHSVTGRCIQRPTPSSRLAAQLRAMVNAHDRSNVTPLIEAARNGQLHCVQWLLQAGADPWLRDRQGKTALHHAARSNYADCTQALVDAAGEIMDGVRCASPHA